MDWKKIGKHVARGVLWFFQKVFRGLALIFAELADFVKKNREKIVV